MFNDHRQITAGHFEKWAEKNKKKNEKNENVEEENERGIK